MVGEGVFANFQKESFKASANANSIALQLLNRDN